MKGARGRRFVLAALLLLGPACATGTAAAATPSPGPGAGAGAGAGAVQGGSAPVTVTVDDIRPRDPRPGDTLQIVGSIRNDGPSGLRAVQVRVRIGDRLGTREALRQADRTQPFYSARDVRDAPDLARGQTTALDVRLPIEDLQLGQDGVYPLQVEVRAITTAGGARAQVGAVSTYLPWFGRTQVDPLRVAWLWPLVDVPRQGPDDVFVDDALSSSLSAGGRLERSLRAARSGETGTCPVPPEPSARTQPARCDPVPVTYVVDPDLLGSVKAMTQPYQVTSTGAAHAGTGGAAARAWLGSLAAATGAVIALPFGDPDAVALTRSTADLGADVAAARSYGDTVASDVLHKPLLQTVAVPPDGPLTDASLDSLTTSATRSVVLGPTALSGATATVRSTPDTRAGLPASSTSGPLTGLTVDAGLSALLTPDRASWHGARLAEQRWLAETAMISAELPNRGRTLLVEPPRRGDVDPDLLAPVLADTGRLPWLCPVAVSDVAAGQEQCPASQPTSHDALRVARLAQVTDTTPQLDAGLLARLKTVRTDANQFTADILRGGTDQAQATRVRLQRGWLRAESSAWREDRAGGAGLVSLLRDDVAALRGKVTLLTGSVTLTSRNGRVSVAVVNALDQAVTVSVRLKAPSVARLSTTQTPVLVVGPGQLLPVDVNATTRTSGRFVVMAQLVDREGNDFGTPQALKVHSTIYGTVALAVTGAGVAVLLIAVAIRLARRAWHR